MFTAVDPAAIFRPIMFVACKCQGAHLVRQRDLDQRSNPGLKGAGRKLESTP